MSRRVLEQHSPPQSLLHFVYVIADPTQRAARVGERQAIVEGGVVMARLGKMLGEHLGLVEVVQGPEPSQMLAVERPSRADRKPRSVQ